MPATAGTPTKKPLQKRPSPNAVLAKMLEYLAEGEYDHQLAFLQGEVHGRMRTKREAKTRQAMILLSDIGTRVRFSEDTRPKYLAGLTGEVVEMPTGRGFRGKTGMIYVKMDVGPVRRFSEVIGVPASLLEAE